ncbi:hypothetical protein TG4357_02160 [Thalassovita gelatinovora]|uniref:Glycosyl transferase family 2 n=1 Tax=Thalassovita gelatinovora TaxID=53501 RepID=A0A0P1FCX7_THAGE|nr:glycosyltransferase family 2 protein [Thalassovita gelatinovora]QIZ80511.1 glycosyltransferase family 2 protein [Thalassovita gelatinovora]CUH65969.1 hypothetical protein TG4357_02160 [Thalassovita gelatinovora]SEQ74659.1 Glycosyl transferase family 2 [Thalassovita gelatinovora]
MTPEKTALVSCMRNEGIFVLEWIAYHQGLGFDAIVIVSNDNTDGSDALLDQLAALGHIIHIRQTLPEGSNPQDYGMDLALKHLRDNGFTWCLHIDSDEFLLIDLGDGKIADLLTLVGRADVVPICWRNFGDSGLTHWTPGASVLRSFTRAEPGPTPGETKSKCLFRVASFARATDHNPLDPLAENPLVLSPDDEWLSNRTLYDAKSARFRDREVSCRARNARLNHYGVKSQDLFLMKNDRGDGQGKQGMDKYLLHSSWHRQANRNDVEDRAILRHWPDTDRRLAALRSDQQIATAERTCQDWFETRRATILTPKTLRAWTKRGAA